MEKQSYSANEIQVLPGLEAIRLRPSLFLEGTPNSHRTAVALACHPLWFASAIEGCRMARAVFHNGGAATVELGTILRSEDVMHLHGGLRPSLLLREAHLLMSQVRIVPAILNAFSASFSLRIYQEGYLYEQRFAFGHEVSPIQKICETPHTKTVLNYRLDREIISGELSQEAIEAEIDRIRVAAPQLDLTVRFAG